MIKKAQGSTEFVLLFMGGLVLIAFMLIGIQKNHVDQEIKNQQKAAEEIVNLVTEEIRIAQISNYEYFREFTLPIVAHGYPYQIELISTNKPPTEIIVTIYDQEYVYYTNLTLHSNSALVKGKNRIYKDLQNDITIRSANQNDISICKNGVMKEPSNPLINKCAFICGAAPICNGIKSTSDPCKVNCGA